MKRNVRRVTNSTRQLTRGALIAALYVGLTYVATVFGLSSGAIQFRISEALLILPIFMPKSLSASSRVKAKISSFPKGRCMWAMGNVSV